MAMIPTEYVFSPPCFEVDELSFRGYSTEDIKRISVVKCDQRDTLDALFHPIPGGLHDQRMGPDGDRGYNRCTTCNQDFQFCPGHLGHIELALACFNPLFFQTTMQMVRGSCVYCHRLMCTNDPHLMTQIYAQLRCVKSGQLANAALVPALLSKHNEEGNNGESLNVENILIKVCENGNTSIPKQKNRCLSRRSTISVRNDIVRAFLRDHLFKRRAKCPFCSRRQPVIKDDFKRALVLSFSESKSNVATPAGILPISLQGIGDSLSAMPMSDSFGPSRPVIDEQLRAVESGSLKQITWFASEVRDHLRLVYCRDKLILDAVFPVIANQKLDWDKNTKKDSSNVGHVNGKTLPQNIDVLFLQCIPVPPPKTRPLRVMQGLKYEHGQTAMLKGVIEAGDLITMCAKVMRYEKNPEVSATQEFARFRFEVSSKLMGANNGAKYLEACLLLQAKVNCLYDGNLNQMGTQVVIPQGIRQLLEKKQGLFRMNMMGKRVNFAARTVITPDPYISIDEIGVPEVFAKKLTFPEFVSNFNEATMRQAVINGPNVNSGANYVRTWKGNTMRVSDSDKTKRIALAADCHAAKIDQPPPTVMRHLKRGDILLMNRQPTLHKPSIMGHRTRVLKKQRTFRMNYAPCKAYNADFDGDEMNAHYVQSHNARTEAFEIAAVSRNYLLPKDGTPILGLIQDHVVSAVILTLRDRFLEKSDYQYLVLSAFEIAPHKIKTLPPAIMKPKQLWTGKQVVSTVILNTLPNHVAPINIKGKTKTSVKNWRLPHTEMETILELSDSQFMIRQGELVQGVLDKSQFGASAYGLIHCTFEFYGPHVACALLSCFSKLFSNYLQLHGFSLGVKDILVTKKADKKRSSAIEKLRKCGRDVVKTAFNMTNEPSEEEMLDTLQRVYLNPKDKTDLKQLDFCMKSGLDVYNNDINKAIMPQGLIELFPSNSLQLMIEAGAKGTMVNAMQISCMLGQIELEGSRPGVCPSGRTLPSFKCFDPSPRAGGFVDQRFLTGVKPQELFFHTMAGREGLIDTACKTASSGYLQRCVIKHLEGIMIAYDGTVRDYDSSVIQFKYGEDGMETGKAVFLKEDRFPILMENKEAVRVATGLDVDSTTNQKTANHIQSMKDAYTLVKKDNKKIGKWKLENKDKKGRYAGHLHFFEKLQDNGFNDKNKLVEEWHKLKPEEKQEFRELASVEPDPVNYKFNNCNSLGALPEKLLGLIEKTEQKEFKDLLLTKSIRAFAPPGECVGLLAAQSVGEPSTQMTLNTFHFAGRGEMNVTLGIPRLREILMSGGRKIKTPLCRIPLNDGIDREKAELVRKKLDRVALKAVVKSLNIVEKTNILKGAQQYREYTITIQVLPRAKRDDLTKHIDSKTVLHKVESKFIPCLCNTLRKRSHEMATFKNLEVKRMTGNMREAYDGEEQATVAPQSSNNDVDAAGESSDEEANIADLDAADAKLNRRHGDENEYEGEGDEKGQVQPDDDSDVEYSDNQHSSKEDEEMAEDMETPGKKRKSSKKGKLLEVNIEETNSVGLTQQQMKENAALMDVNRKNLVLGSSNMISDYGYDAKKNRWCIFDIQMPVDDSHLDVHTIVKREMERIVVQAVQAIDKCAIRHEHGEWFVQTQGINLAAMFKFGEVFNLNKVKANDIHLVADTYGIEAAARIIVNEVVNVFGGYGIEVDLRHLTLLADYMTVSGVYRAFNRGAMAYAPGPLHKMTFETTMNFMKEALTQGDADNICSPSASIVTGSMMKMGTGAFDLKMPSYQLFADVLQPKVKVKKENVHWKQKEEIVEREIKVEP